MRVFKKVRTAKRFTIELRDHLGIARRFSGLTDKRQTEQLGARIEKLVEVRISKGSMDADMLRWLETLPTALKARLAVVGIIDGDKVSGTKPLSDLLEDYTAHMKAKELTTQHIQDSGNMVRRVFKDCRFAVYSDIQAGAVERFLKGLRDGGLSKRRSNGYLVAMKSFCRWMVDTSQAAENPLRKLKELNEKTDVRRERRAATPDELRRLIATTAQGDESFGMGGPERSLLYRFCAESGLRANEARTLTAGSFDLDGLTVRVKAGYSKHRQEDTVPLRPELAKALQEHLKGRLPTAKVFGGRYKKLTRRTSAMFQADLVAAEIEYVDNQGRYLDFHGTRHSFITGLRNAPSRVAQSLARHKSSAMTDRYTHVRLHDERAALEMLPDLTAHPTEEQAQATGTDGAAATDPQLFPTQRIQSPENGARHGAHFGIDGGSSSQVGANTNPAGAITNGVSEWAGLELNQRHTDFQSV